MISRMAIISLWIGTFGGKVMEDYLPIFIEGKNHEEMQLDNPCTGLQQVESMGTYHLPNECEETTKEPSGKWTLQASKDTKKIDILFAAIAEVESKTNDKAYNKKEKAIGRYQIRPNYFLDANLAGSHNDCFGREFSERVMLAYWQRYCPKALADGNYETLTRVHNGGPKGHAKQSTIKYWHKVQKALLEQGIKRTRGRQQVNEAGNRSAVQLRQPA